MNEVLSLALFPYVSGKTFSRFAKWQRTHKTLLDCELTSPGIAKLLASITDDDRMNFIRLRLERLTGKPMADCDSGASVTAPSEIAPCLALASAGIFQNLSGKYLGYGCDSRSNSRFK